MRSAFSRPARPALLLWLALACATRAAEAADDGANPGSTFADADGPQRADRSLIVDVGFGSTVGFAGIAYSETPLEHLRLELGAGWGITGAQLALMPKWIFNRERALQLLLGVGPSLSLKPMDPHDANSELHKTGIATWLNAEFGLEHRFTGTHLAMAVAVNVSVGLSGNYLLKNPYNSNTYGTRGSVLPGTRFGLGYAF